MQRNDFEIEFSSGSTRLEKGITVLEGEVSKKTLRMWSRTSQWALLPFKGFRQDIAVIAHGWTSLYVNVTT